MKNPEHLLADANEVRTLEDWGADLSIVVPVKDEVDSLPQLYEELCAVMAGLDLRSELIFVDDGSTDDSAELVERWTQRDPTVGLIRLRGNFGKAAALAAGFGIISGIILFDKSDICTGKSSLAGNERR